MPKGVYKRTKKHTEQNIKNLPKNPQYWKGKKFSKKHKQKMSENHSGMSGKNHTEESRKKMSKSKIGWETTYKGSKHHAWKGGITPNHVKIRNSPAYKRWRTMIFKRDDYTCQECGARSGNGKRVTLNAHHIKSFAKYTELRLSIKNGITLCIKCHK